MHRRRHIHVALSALQSVCGALMCVPSRMRHPDTAALKRVIIFLGLPLKRGKKKKKSDVFASDKFTV